MVIEGLEETAELQTCLERMPGVQATALFRGLEDVEGVVEIDLQPAVWR